MSAPATPGTARPGTASREPAAGWPTRGLSVLGSADGETCRAGPRTTSAPRCRLTAPGSTPPRDARTVTAGRSAAPSTSRWPGWHRSAGVTLGPRWTRRAGWAVRRGGAGEPPEEAADQGAPPDRTGSSRRPHRGVHRPRRGRRDVPVPGCDTAGTYHAFPEGPPRSEEHTSELQSLRHLVCRLLLEKRHN